MKQILLAGITMLSSLITIAQTDTTIKGNKEDTVFVGNFIIIKNNKDRNTYNDSLSPKREDYTIINIPGHKHYSGAEKNLTTNWLIFDLGFLNYNDKTDYSNPGNFAAPGITKNDLKLITVKSSNVNIWLFMQRLNISEHIVNLKYGLGLNMYNYRYNSNISFEEDPPYVTMDTLDFSKNKLYAAYATIPLMININPSPKHRHGFNFSFGVSAGYRMNTHTKQISDEFGKVKNHDNFDLDPWLLAYTAEMGIGPVRVYGSYSINTLFQDAKHYPYTIGLRLSNW
jgi:hypothetical protein